MKKIVIIISAFLLLISCSTDTNETNVSYELVPIQNVTLPDTIAVGEENNIVVEYFKPSTCHGFDGFLYEKSGLVRTIAVQNYIYQNNDCQPLTSEVKLETLKFQPVTLGTYTFKFWQGKDTSGNDVFLEFERPSKIY